MPTRAKTGKSTARQSYPETIWVSCELSQGEKDDLRARGVLEKELLQSLDALISEGFKVSVSYDSRSDCVGCYATAPKDAYPGRTVCLSARAPRLAQAVAVLLYKHFEVLREDWTEHLGAAAQKDQWG